MVRFGPAGNSDSFYAEGNKATEQMPAWVSARGLNAFEYSFGRGVRISDAKGRLIAERAAECGIAMSVHAPYFINMSYCDDERMASNWNYFRESARGAAALGAKRLIFHPGSASKIDRREAMKSASKTLLEMLSRLDAEGYDVALCPETMGKKNQLGDLDEVIELCTLDSRLIPTVDFGHMHARGLGAISGAEDYAAILDALESGLGKERIKHMHVHFSQIEFTNAGEKKHHNFGDGFGPDFGPLAQICVERSMEPVFICESRGRMAEDAMSMKRMWEAAEKGV